MDEDQIRAEISEIRSDMEAKLRRLNELLELLDGDDQSPPRRRLWIVPGGAAAVVAALGTAATHRPRHPIGTAAAAAVVGAFAAILVIPAHTTPGGPGNTVSQLTIPYMPPAILGIAPATPGTRSAAPSTSAGTHASSSPQPGRTPSPIPTPSNATAPASRAPAPPSPAASTSASATSASPTATASPSCILEVTLTGIIRVCVR